MSTARFYRLANSPWRMRLFLLWRLPAAWFMGFRVQHCDPEKCVVSLPYGWRAQNPFRSTYFAAQCGAAELSTGLLVLAALQEGPPVSMLVTRIEGNFLKKAADTLLFTCLQGIEIKEVIERVMEGNEAREYVMRSEGRLPDGTVAATVRITWSFKRKNAKPTKPA